MISRRHFIQKSIIGTAGLSLSSPLVKLLFQNGYQMKVLRNNVGIFTERGGTIAYMISSEGIAVVDSQFPDQSQHLIDEIKKQSERKIDLLVNTHHHGDHTAGNIAFKGLVNKVVAHENSMLNQKTTAEARGGLDGQLLPNTTYKSGVHRERVGGERIALHYFGAGHTNGDSFVHFENANIVHTGDLLFNRRVPYIDKSAGADIANWQQVLEKAYNTFDADTLFVYGHSGEGYEITGNREDLKAFQNYLAQVLSFVKKGKANGKTKEELAQANEIPGAPEWKGNQSRAVQAAWLELFGE
ncbi:MAG: MBL fold metallo-hydrolase [Bacteroidota bacterium]|nr:MBL fold metallo-hydrolase [Bacteroidota bacterium]